MINIHAVKDDTTTTKTEQGLRQSLESTQLSPSHCTRVRSGVLHAARPTNSGAISNSGLLSSVNTHGITQANLRQHLPRAMHFSLHDHAICDLRCLSYPATDDVMSRPGTRARTSKYAGQPVFIPHGCKF